MENPDDQGAREIRSGVPRGPTTPRGGTRNQLCPHKPPGWLSTPGGPNEVDKTAVESIAATAWKVGRYSRPVEWPQG